MKFNPFLTLSLIVPFSLGALGIFYFDKHQDNSTLKYVESSIQTRLGSNTKCEQANDDLFRHKVTVDNCIIANHADFPSKQFAHIYHIEIDSKNLKSNKSTEINDLLLEGVSINFDIKAIPPAINLQKLLSNNGMIRTAEEAEDYYKKFFIKTLKIKNIQVTVNFPNFIGSKQKTFILNDIELTNLHNDNYQAQIRQAIQQQVNNQLKVLLGENTKFVVDIVLDLISSALNELAES